MTSRPTTTYRASSAPVNGSVPPPLTPPPVDSPATPPAYPSPANAGAAETARIAAEHSSMNVHLRAFLIEINPSLGPGMPYPRRSFVKPAPARDRSFTGHAAGERGRQIQAPMGG